MGSPSFRALALLLVAAAWLVSRPALAWDDAKVIAEATGGQFTAPKGQYMDQTCNVMTDYQADVVDLNGDGQPEVFVQIFGTCWGGMTGVHVTLYVKGADGTWTKQLGFPGMYQLLETKHLGYPDIEIGGPGMCFPIWRWNGQAYALYKKCPR